MRKVTVITLITTLLLLVVPGLSGCSSKPTSGNATSQEYTRSVVVPDHMWTMSMTEEQLDSLKNCWGSEMTILELTDLLWPEIVNFIPDHMVNHWSDKELKWSNTKLPNPTSAVS